MSIEIVKRSNGAKGFSVEPQRWIVERTIGWLPKTFPPWRRAFTRLRDARVLARRRD